MTVSTLMSADELLALPDDGSRYELVRGELRKMSPTGGEHALVETELALSLGVFVKERRLGRIYTGDCGFRIQRDPDTVRAPDVAFVRAERVVRTKRFIEGAPDAAFEIVSPSDTYSEVEEKTIAWLRAGCRVVVIVDPATMSVRIHRAGGVTAVTDAIEIQEVIPGWRLALHEVFE